MINSRFKLKTIWWPLAAYVLLLAGMLGTLHLMGRVWWCKCGALRPWDGHMWSLHTSQHLFDYYSFTHVLHGVIFCGMAWLVFRTRLRFRWRLWVATLIEVFWEILENTPFIIQRYRETTIDQGYEGDAIANSLGDIACCAIGFAIASRLGWKWSLLLLVVVETALLLLMRDNLTLNILMLLYPVDAIKQWQMGGLPAFT